MDAPFALKVTSLVSSVCVAALALTSLLGWLTGQRLLASFDASFIPMAPNTAVCFLLLAAGMMAIARGCFPRVSLMAACVVSSLALARLIELSTGSEFGVDSLFYSAPAETLGHVPVGQMSFFTALNFIYLGLASGLAATLLEKATGLVAFLSAVACGLGMAFTLGYVYGAPLLYGGESIPMALNTALSFVLASAALLAIVGRDAILRRRRTRAEIERLNQALSLRIEELQYANLRLKEASMHLIQAEKMVSLGQLVAGIAHEVNNPIAFVLANHFTVEDRLDKIAPEVLPHLFGEGEKHWNKARLRLSEMKIGLERVADLVVQLRTFSRLDEAKLKQVDLRECVVSVTTLLRHRLRDGLQVECDFQGSTVLTCNPGQINQVLMNLVANSADAAPTKIKLSSRVVGNIMLLEIADDGCGIPPEVLPRIFDPFYTTKPQGQGVGLGLAISYAIIKDHQGTIEAESSSTGTVLKVSLPVTPPPAVKIGAEIVASRDEKTPASG